MIHSDAKSARERGDRLFAAKRTWDSRNQDIAEQFYPERADFTVTRGLGDEFADHLVTGYPSLVRRDLGNSLGAMLRPRGQDWFHTRTAREDKEDHEAKRWLEWAATVQRRAMYDRASNFTRATKEGDHDFSAFGGCAISTEVNRRDTALLYRCWHLRDMAWAEDSYGILSEYHRDWEPTCSEVCYFFPKTVHAKTVERKDKDPHAKTKVRHVVLRSDEYTGLKVKQPWITLFVDCENDCILEERGSWTPIYTLPRWATVSGSQYPYSPATIVALPDARLIQAMTLTLLDAGERAANPPMVGVSEAIRGDLNIYPGGFTAVDAEYDERLGEVLRPLVQDKSGIPYGMDMADRQNEILREAFYLNKLSMPPAGGPDMTAYEVGQRVQEYIRQAMPLFEPMEHDYNGSLCEITFETLLREGAFGSPENIPESIRGAEVQFAFESPISQMAERAKGQKFMEARAMIAQAVDVDPDVTMIIDFKEALRDVLEGIGTPAKWTRSKEEVAAAAEQNRQKQEAAQLLATMTQGADVAQKLGAASQSFGAVA